MNVSDSEGSRSLFLSSESFISIPESISYDCRQCFFLSPLPFSLLTLSLPFPCGRERPWGITIESSIKKWEFKGATLASNGWCVHYSTKTMGCRIDSPEIAGHGFSQHFSFWDQFIYFFFQGSFFFLFSPEGLCTISDVLFADIWNLLSVGEVYSLQGQRANAHWPTGSSDCFNWISSQS